MSKKTPETEKCPTCKGIGSIKDYDSFYEQNMDIVCPECNGTGEKEEKTNGRNS